MLVLSYCRNGYRKRAEKEVNTSCYSIAELWPLLHVPMEYPCQEAPLQGIQTLHSLGHSEWYVRHISSRNHAIRHYWRQLGVI